MKKKLGFIIIFILATFQLWAGWKIVIQQNDRGVTHEVTYSITNDGIKISNSDFDFIYYKGAKKIIVINHRRNSYFFGSFEEYKNQLVDVYHIDSLSADSLLPQSFSFRFEKQLDAFTIPTDSSGERKYTLNVKGDIVKKEILGYASQEYEVLLDTILIKKLWLTQELELKNESLILEAFDFFRGHNKSSHKSPKYLQSKEYDRLSQQSFSLKSILYEKNGSEYFSSEVIFIEEVELDEERTFSIPETYMGRTLIDLIVTKE